MVNSESAVERMAETAAAFVAGLDASQRAVAAQPFGDDAARRDWHYVPRVRPGLSFREMTAAQAKAAYALLATGLAGSALAATTTIIGLEDVLDEIEGRTRHRHRADYSTTVFGDPEADTQWGWRFEGHHVSVNVTVAEGEVAATPLFLGANPAEVLTPTTGHAVTRPLAAEEDLALELFDRLDDDQREEAWLSHDAPDDILTKAAPRLDELPVVAGLRLAKLSGSTESLAEALVRLYLDRLPPPIAEKRWARLRPVFGDVRFAFAGEPAHRRPHYYRLTGPALFVEYDNTQDGANHIHSVLRDPEGDFGEDLLRAHRKLDHGV
ncbi:MAG: hypothetical protein QOF60_1993 [Actinomycetota bacterium]|nr:hypothetical protein [Actinomycetota bacterium]